MARRPSTDDIIECIENIRATNNTYWMEVLRIAMEYDPARTRKIVKTISENDREVNKWLDKL